VIRRAQLGDFVVVVLGILLLVGITLLARRLLATSEGIRRGEG
jgi:hypothetical protein